MKIQALNIYNPNLLQKIEALPTVLKQVQKANWMNVKISENEAKIIALYIQETGLINRSQLKVIASA